MCGLAGAFHPSGIDPAPVADMLASLQHRGPDEGGVHLLRDRSGRPWAALGTRRLAITDPAGGHQPQHDPDRRWWVTLNGEIYNHGQLRKEMLANDVPLKTRSDTEVAAAMLGWMPIERAMSRLDGMFAMAVVDEAERRLYLVRDRLGVKPLYWTQLPDGTVLWGSELKALCRHPGLRRALDPVAIRQLLMFEYVPGPGSALLGVRKVEPGTWVVVDEQGAREVRWWTPPVPEPGSAGNRPKWAKSVAGALQVAVMSRMHADVPVGYVLSGGLDSSAVLAMAAARAREPLHSFTLAVDAPGFDEAPHARKVAGALGTVHHEARLGPDDLPGLLDEIAASLDEPLADSSLPATWRLMRLVRDTGFRCVMSGDGADESFGGYPTIQAHRLAPLLTPFGSALRRATAALPVDTRGVSADYKARRFALGLGLPWQRRHQVWMGAWLPDELGVEPDDPAWAVVDQHAAAAASADAASRALYLDQRLYLGDGVLVKMDRASMAHGVEVRSPFLDHHLVELAASIPIGHKVEGRQGKVVLRMAVADLLPPEVLARPKQGFGTPVGPWLKGPLRAWLDALTDDRRLDAFIPREALRRAVDEHVAGRADHRRRLWSALVLSRWLSGPWAPA